MDLPPDRQVAVRIKRAAPDRWTFFCPACDWHHQVNDTWQFNGNQDLPTFSPSILVSNGKVLYQRDPKVPGNEKIGEEEMIGKFSGKAKKEFRTAKHPDDSRGQRKYELEASLTLQGILEIDAFLGDESVADFQFTDDVEEHPGELYPLLSNVDPAHQRLGIASAVYKWAEELTGLPVAPSSDQTSAAKRFWKARSKVEVLLDRIGKNR